MEWSAPEAVAQEPEQAEWPEALVAAQFGFECCNASIFLLHRMGKPCVAGFNLRCKLPHALLSSLGLGSNLTGRLAHPAFKVGTQVTAGYRRRCGQRLRFVQQRVLDTENESIAQQRGVELLAETHVGNRVLCPRHYAVPGEAP